MDLLRFLLDLISLAASASVAVLSICAFRILRDAPPSWWPLGDARKRRRYHPIGGTVLHRLLNFSRLYDFHTELSRRYRTYRLLGPYHDQIFTTEPAIVEHVLRTNAANYGKGEHNYKKLYELFGDGIFAVDGEKWRIQRKFVSPEFSNKVLKASSIAVFKANAAELAQLVSAAAINHGVIEMQDLFMRSTMDSVFETMAGVKLNGLLGSDEEGAAFSMAFDDLSAQISLRFLNPFWKIMRFMNIGSESTLNKNMHIIDDFLYNLIDAKAISLANKEEERKVDLLSRLLVEMNNDSKCVNKKYLRDVLLNFLTAGKDTTGGTLSWFFYMLCKNPLVQERIVLEIREKIGSDAKTGIHDFANCITEESLNRMKYLHAALTETLRLYPAVPMDSKVCFSDDILPDGFSVRKGDIVNYQPYPMGRMEHLWGNDAAVFKPERWLDENGYFSPESPFKFTAFQAGPRICMGKEFAYYQMKIFSIVLLNFFKFKLSNENGVVNYKITITLHMDEGLHVYAYHR